MTAQSICNRGEVVVLSPDGTEWVCATVVSATAHGLTGERVLMALLVGVAVGCLLCAAYEVVRRFDPRNHA